MAQFAGLNEHNTGRALPVRGSGIPNSDTKKSQIWNVFLHLQSGGVGLMVAGNLAPANFLCSNGYISQGWALLKSHYHALQ